MAVRLTGKEADLLSVLASSPGAVSSEELMRRVWGWQGRSHTVATTIYTLRRKVEANPARPRQVLTVRGAGYRFAPISTRPWPIGLDGRQTVDRVIDAADVLAAVDGRAARAMLQAGLLHPAAQEDRRAWIHHRLAQLFQHEGRLVDAARHVHEGMAVARSALTVGCLEMVDALILWRLGRDPVPLVHRAQRALSGELPEASVAFHRVLFDKPTVEPLTAAVPDIAPDRPRVGAVFLLAAAHLARGDQRVRLGRQAAALALAGEAPHEHRLGQMAVAAGEAERGNLAEARAIWQGLDAPGPRHGEMFGHGLAWAGQRAMGLPLSAPPPRVELCPLTRQFL